MIFAGKVVTGVVDVQKKYSPSRYLCYHDQTIPFTHVVQKRSVGF